MLEARGICLRPVRDSDLPLLIAWRNDPAQLHLWATYRHIGTETETVEEVLNELDHNRHITMVIERVRDDAVVGFIYSYDVQFVDGFCFITTFVDSRHRGKGYGAVAHGLFLDYLLTFFHFGKVYGDVYSYNPASLSALLNAGYKIEGRFPSHRFYNGKHYEMVRLAFYRAQHGELRRLMAKMSASSTEGSEKCGRQQRRRRKQ